MQKAETSTIDAQKVVEEKKIAKLIEIKIIKILHLVIQREVREMNFIMVKGTLEVIDYA